MSWILTELGSVPASAERIAQIVKDFDDTLELAMIPVEQRTAFDAKPYAIVQRHPNYAPYIVMALAENELDHRVIETLFKARIADNDVMGQLKAANDAAEVMRLRERMDRIEEERKFTNFVLKSSNPVKHEGVVYE